MGQRTPQQEKEVNLCSIFLFDQYEKCMSLAAMFKDGKGEASLGPGGKDTETPAELGMRVPRPMVCAQGAESWRA